jgi:hypothetical protein
MGMLGGGLGCDGKAERTGAGEKNAYSFHADISGLAARTPRTQAC